MLILHSLRASVGLQGGAQILLPGVRKHSLRYGQAGAGIVWLLGAPVTAEEPHGDVKIKVSWEEAGAMVVIRLFSIQAPLKS